MLLEKIERLAKILFIIDQPMSRLPYFKINIIGVGFGLLFLYVILLGSSALPDTEFSKLMTFSSLALVFILAMVISVVLTSKRLWDILGKKVPAIICSCILIVVVGVLGKMFNIIALFRSIAIVSLFLIKGKDRNKMQVSENKEEVSKEG